MQLSSKLRRGVVLYFRRCFRVGPRKKQSWVRQQKNTFAVFAAALLLLFLGHQFWSSTPKPSPLHRELQLVPVEPGSKAFLLSAFYDARPLVLLSSPRIVLLSVFDVAYLRLLYKSPPRHQLQCITLQQSNLAHRCCIDRAR
jgi:hypothetical protein